MAAAVGAATPHDAVARFHQSLVYRQTAPIDRILADLSAILELDRASKGRAARWRWLGAAALIAGIALFVLGLAMGEKPSAGLVVVGLVCIVAAIILFVVVAPRAGHLGVDERRLDLVRNLLGLERVRSDIGSSPARVELDLRKATDKAKQTDSHREGADHFTTFVDPWLQVEAALRDRSALRAAVVERTVVRQRTKKSRSGKMKTKSKRKARLAVALTVRRPRSAGSFAASAPPPAAVDVPPGVVVKDVAYKDRAVTIKTVAPGEWSPDGGKGQLNATDLLGRLYDAGRRLAASPVAA